VALRGLDRPRDRSGDQRSDAVRCRRPIDGHKMGAHDGPVHLSALG